MRGTAAEKFRIFFDPSRFDRPVSSKTSSTFFHYQTMIATENETYQEQHAAFQRQPSPTWLTELRQQGFEAFMRLGIPNRRLEDWRFTNVAPLAKRPYVLASRAPSANEITNDDIQELVAQTALDDNFHRLVFINGRYSSEWSRLHELSAGVVIDNLMTV